MISMDKIFPWGSAFNRIYFEMYLPYAIKISKLGNISIIPNKYFIKEDFEK